MIYKAVVLDNTMFYTRGTIRVRIAGFFQRNFSWNLADNFPDFIEEGEGEDEFSQDHEAYLTSPLGGGRNYGMFFLPQINEKGLVAFLGENRRTPVWLGSFYEPERDDNFEITHVNIPSDDPAQEGEDTDGVIEGSHNMKTEEEGDELNKNIVIRTKNTSRESEEKVDWQQQSTTNIISISDKEVRTTHFSPEEGWDDTTPQKWQELLISKNEDDKDQIKSEVHNEKDSKIGKLTLTEDGFNVELDNDGDINTFSIKNNGDGVSLTFEDKNGNTMNIDDSDGISISTEKDINMSVSGKVNIAGAGDTVVLYSQLKKIVEAFEKHIHQTPVGPTVGPPLNSDQSPIISKTTSAKNQMKSKKVDSD